MRNGKTLGAVKPVTLLWSGGWDSTFRILELLLVHRVHVRPVYILDRSRDSLSHELRTMEHLRSSLNRDHPFTRRLLAPTQFFELSTVQPHPGITKAYREVNARRSLGGQFDWLARFLEDRGWTRVEMGLETGPLAQRVILPSMVRVRRGPFWTYRVAPQGWKPLRVLLARFDLPLLETSKRDMLEAARKYGWEKFMFRTWFCHHPAPDGRPCGRCNPCDSTIQDGLSFRVPAHRRWLGFLYRVLTGRWKYLPVDRSPKAFTLRGKER